MRLPKYIVDEIKNFNRKGEMRLCAAGIGKSDIDELITLLNTNPKITGINLDRNNLNIPSLKKLVQLQHVTTLIVSNQFDFDDETAIILMRAKQFRVLDFTGNRQITDKAGLIFKNETTQKKIIMDRTSISEALQKEIRSKNARISNSEFNIDEWELEQAELEQQKIADQASPAASGMFSYPKIPHEELKNSAEEFKQPMKEIKVRK